MNRLWKTSVDDPWVKTALDWFLGFLSPTDWTARKQSIRNYLTKVHETRDRSTPLYADYTRISYSEDTFGWYLFLAQSYTSKIEEYDFSQGARIIPFFRIIGEHLGKVKTIPGVEGVVSRMIDADRASPDGALFELVMGLLYVRNGWKKVEFLNRSSTEKTPDIHIQSASSEFFIECKRLSKSSAYSENERICWLKMFEPLRKYLSSQSKPLIIDITFHVELASLGDNYIKKALVPKLDFVWSKGVVIDNGIWTVAVDFVDFEKIKRHFSKYSVKMPSTAIIDLVFGHYEPWRGYSPVYMDKKNPRSSAYIDDILFAAGAVWSCDCEAAINKKSRHILSHLSEACSQLPTGIPGIVHIGLESHDGPIVEDERFKKIMDKTTFFDPEGKDLHWIYGHIFDPRVPPDQNWDFGETVLHFRFDRAVTEPLARSSSVLPEDARTYDGVFWRE